MGLLNRLRNLAFGEYIGDLKEEIAALYREEQRLREYASRRNIEAARLETQLRNKIAELETPTVQSVQLELLQRALAQAQGENRSLKALLATAKNENQHKSFELHPSPIAWSGADVRSIRDARAAGPNRTESVPSAAILPVPDDAYEPRVFGTCSKEEPGVTCTTVGGDGASCVDSNSSSAE